MRFRSGVAAVCAILSPVLAMGGAVVAASRQPPGYSPIRQTLSVLASLGATDRWIMTGTLMLLGLAYVVIAVSLGGVPVRARIVLAVAGVAVLLAGALPQPVGGSSLWHMGAATVAWVAFTLWPLAVCRHDGDPGLLGRRPTWGVTAVLVVLMAWFAVELWSDGPYLGLAERVLVVAQTLWPITVVLAHRSRHARAAAGLVPEFSTDALIPRRGREAEQPGVGIEGFGHVPKTIY